MRQAQTMQARETVDEAIVRLAMEARRSGVRVYRANETWYATSQSRPGVLHRLSAYSCTCDGFLRWQRCRHHSALLDHLNWLPSVTPDPDPEPPTSPGTSECHECLGSGYVRAYFGGHLSDWVAAPCNACDAPCSLRHAA
jgi:hypothetical protein